MEESRPLDTLGGLTGKTVIVTLKNGSAYKGCLKAFDTYTNIVLENCEDVNQKKKRSVVFIPGHWVEQCSHVEDS